MAELHLYQTCRFCKGTGVVTNYPSEGPPVQGPCPKCNATGKFYTGIIEGSDDLADTINDILDKVNDIKEAIDAM